MLAGDLAAPYMSCTVDDEASAALQVMAERRLPALLVVDRAGWPYAVVPASLVVEHLLGDRRVGSSRPGRARRRRVGVKVASWLPEASLPALVVDARWTAHHVGEAMARAGSPLAVVAEGGDGTDRRVMGVITACRLHDALAGEPGCPSS